MKINSIMSMFGCITDTNLLKKPLSNLSKKDILVITLYLIILLLTAISYRTDFMAAGDGLAYQKVAEDIVYGNNMDSDINRDELINSNSLINDNYVSRLFRFLKNLNLGFIPGYILGKAFPNIHNSIGFYVSQNIVYFIVLLLAYTYFKNHQHINKENLGNTFAISLLAPYMLIIGAYPTKYLLIFVSLFVSLNYLYLATATKKRNEVIYFILSLFFLSLFKFQLALTLLTIWFVILAYYSDKYKYLYIVSIIAILLFIYLYLGYFIELYTLQSNDGRGRKFDYAYGNIFFKLIIKYIMAIFGGVPQNLNEGGKFNQVIYLLYMVVPLVLLFQLINYSISLKQHIQGFNNLKYNSFLSTIALLMSTTIFWGKTGFLEYLCIFFPLIDINYEKVKIIYSFIFSLLIYIIIIYEYIHWPYK